MQDHSAGSPLPDTGISSLQGLVYPLQRMYWRHVLPWLLLCTAVLILVTVVGGRHLVESVYLEQAGRDARSIVQTLIREGDASAARWFENFDNALATPVPAEDLQQVAKELDDVVRDRALPKLKIYDIQGVIRYSSVKAEIGKVERGEGLDAVLRSHGRAAVRVEMPEGPQFELYVFLPSGKASPVMVVEVYEPSAFLDQSLRRTLIPAVLLPALVLLVVTALLSRMVGKAQQHLVAQRTDVEALQKRLERLVSNRAALAARTGLSPLLDGHMIDVTLYFADVRDFTSFAEANRAEHVVQLLNRLISIQVDAINRFGGDVDKILGDAVLAVFTGNDRSARAIACAQDILRSCCAQSDLPRSLAIGVHDGVAVAGTIGAPDRQDYTVIGDAVNVSQRLCTLAQVNELVCDTRTLQRAGHPDDFGVVEDQRVKGRSESLRVRRWRCG